MAAGGIHDQLGGGFHRYATDAAWLVPHFEQMLYDNAQLARVYAHAWALTGDAGAASRRRPGCSTTSLRELTTPDGGFAASQDADTEGEEGGTFVWTAAEVREVLGDDAALFSAAYGVTDAGNWEGRTILSRVRDDAELAERFGLAVDEVGARLAAARAVAAGAGAPRAPQPARDDKVLAAWNGLAIAAFADAARSLAATGDPAHGRARGPLSRGGAAGGRRRCSTASGGRTGGSADRGATAGRRPTACSRTTRTSPTGCSPLYEATFDERWFDGRGRR